MARHLTQLALGAAAKATLALVALLVAPVVDMRTAQAQQTRTPVGHWESSGAGTYTNFAVTGARLYLNIDVSADGRFRGVWGEYFCTSGSGASVYGIPIFNCSVTRRMRVSGQFGSGREGAIDLEQLGRSAFTWSMTAPDQLAIDLPKHWQGDSAVLYEARLTPDGRLRPSATDTASAPADDPLLSGDALFREFRKDEAAALRKYAGRTLVLEGRRGAVFPLSDGGVSVHVPDGFTSRALVLVFRDRGQIRGLEEGSKFRFQCTVKDFEYQYVQLENCSILR
jgi:hypothetical protein